jgi:hypothetical protein
MRQGGRGQIFFAFGCEIFSPRRYFRRVADICGGDDRNKMRFDGRVENASIFRRVL